MVLERTSELHYLNTYYDREGSQIMVVYGGRNVGKKSLLWQFAGGKPGYYYRARSASDREQRYQWGRELEGDKKEYCPSYAEILQLIFQGTSEDFEQEAVDGSFSAPKKVIIIDEFQYIVKSGGSFTRDLLSFVRGRSPEAGVMVILCSSSVGWVENNMITRIGEAAFELSGLLKIREMGFEDMMKFYPGFSMRQGIEAYAVLGGVPGLWTHFNDRYDIRENICRRILHRDAALYGEGQRIVEEELREMGVYNTILASIAAGHHKLNDLYLHTEFSRAKISVYLKNLMELEIVEKVFSYDTEGKANTQKGIYRISNHMVHFYFTYLYPNLSSLERMKPEAFYDRYIAPSFNSYVAHYFRLICRQYVEKMNRRGKLAFPVEKFGEWVGKQGTIDLVARHPDGRTILGICNWDKPLMHYEDYERLLLCAEKAKLKADYIYLFSIHRFDEKLKLEAKVKPNLRLISVDVM